MMRADQAAELMPQQFHSPMVPVSAAVVVGQEQNPVQRIIPQILCDECRDGHQAPACDFDPPRCDVWNCSRGGPPCYGGSLNICECEENVKSCNHFVGSVKSFTPDSVKRNDKASVSPQTESFDESSRSSLNVQHSVAYPSTKTIAVDTVKIALSRIEAALKSAYNLIADAEVGGAQLLRPSRKLDTFKRKARPPNASAPNAAKAAALESSERTRKRNRVEMLDAHGLDERGREPCYFHHRVGSTKCRFNANVCKAGHHNGRARDA